MFELPTYKYMIFYTPTTNPVPGSCMPHCIIEYANPIINQIEPQTIVEAVQRSAENAGLFSSESIKTRAIGYDHFTSLDNLNFIHVNVKLLSDRTEQQKRQLSVNLLHTLEGLKLCHISLTVEIIDVHSESYAKSIVR